MKSFDLIIFLQVRHAQANHNVAGKKDHDALLSPEFFDASLSSLGLEQVRFTCYLHLIFCFSIGTFHQFIIRLGKSHLMDCIC